MNVAIVHYWLVGMRGGEKTLEAFLELFPQADIYTHVYDPDSVSDKIKNHKIITSYINRLPFAKKLYQIYMPLMPAALIHFNLQKYELVISSEAGPAKGVVPSPDAYHICYCHSPMRYIWDMYHEYSAASGLIKRAFMHLLTPRLRLWDVYSANLVDRFITNSNWTAKRIKRYYNREAEVVFGPADIEGYIETERAPEDYYLFFGQVTYNKRVDIAIEACVNLQKKLIVAGAVSSMKFIEAYQKTELVQFTGRVSAEKIKKLFAGAKALLFPGIEDMGFVPLEAQAAGCPVIAFRKGGALDTIVEGKTGVFFDEPNSSSLALAIQNFEASEAQFNERSIYTEYVRRFSKAAFFERVKKIIDEKKRV
ncbi:MAG: glycosyltransferase [Spirochaetaceae bacterium]|jgi:glycosyltransferase involved in cell wall biosynthesis|nr:glycosyltransferase [Spirochaetaceae bacterium]